MHQSAGEGFKLQLLPRGQSLDLTFREQPRFILMPGLITRRSIFLPTLYGHPQGNIQHAMVHWIGVGTTIHANENTQLHWHDAYSTVHTQNFLLKSRHFFHPINVPSVWQKHPKMAVISVSPWGSWGGTSSCLGLEGFPRRAVCLSHMAVTH